MLGLFGVALLSFLAGCASLPPGSDFPKTTSIALTRPEQTRIGQQLAAAKAEHAGLSGFRLLPVGIDSFLLRMEMAEAAARTLDVQYFLIQSDDTGQLLIQALLKAADRGVRVRVLLDIPIEALARRRDGCQEPLPSRDKHSRLSPYGNQFRSLQGKSVVARIENSGGCDALPGVHFRPAAESQS
jgi:phosphatidylserine/phosphatidylglycerophosphate/cardiolipin synthase-like enzyme